MKPQMFTDKHGLKKIENAKWITGNFRFDYSLYAVNYLFYPCSSVNICG